MIARWILFALVAVAANGVASYAAYRRRSLNGTGAIAAATVGSLIMVAGGLLYWMMLILFFVSSSLASRVGRARKERLERMHEKGSRRDHVQVIANGGVGALLVLLLQLTGNAAFGVAAAAAFASVNADTWASEFGVLSAHQPRSITNWRPLEPGTSGGVSLLGTGAALAGGLAIAAWYAIAHLTPSLLSLFVPTPDPTEPGPGSGTLFLIVLAAGFIGTTVDSLLGATVQAQYRDRDGSITERRTTGGRPNERVRGLPFFTNDVVNLVSAAVASAAALVVSLSMGA
ncbi:MAG: DUF92 domain-containing protein [Spirochaetota bacterium]